MLVWVYFCQNATLLEGHVAAHMKLDFIWPPEI